MRFSSFGDIHFSRIDPAFGNLNTTTTALMPILIKILTFAYLIHA